MNPYAMCFMPAHPYLNPYARQGLAWALLPPLDVAERLILGGLPLEIKWKKIKMKCIF
jgi:hypothetical protein